MRLLINVILLKASVSGAMLKTNIFSNRSSFATKFYASFLERDINKKNAPKDPAVLMAYKVWVFWNDFWVILQSWKSKLTNEGSGCSVALKTLFPIATLVLKI